MNTLPISIGAALDVKELANYRDWLIADQRDLEIQDFYDNNLLDADWKPLIQAAKAQLDGYHGRLGIHGPTDGLPLITVDKRVRHLVQDRLKQALEVCAELAGTHMVLHSPFDCFGHPQMHHSWSRGLQQEIDAAHAVLDAIVPLAAPINCTLVIEVCYDNSITPLLSLVRSFASPFVQLSLDTGHALIMHQFGGPMPDQWVSEAGALLGHVHLQDVDGHLDRHWPPGMGNVNWQALFAALGTLQHLPRLVLELDDAGKIPQAMHYLAELGLAK